MLIFHLDKVPEGHSANEFRDNSFIVLSIRINYVIVKCNSNEDYYVSTYPIHEFPIQIGTFRNVQNVL